MRRALPFGLLALTLSLTGCLRDPDPLELDDNAITVHALLVAESDSALVWITRAKNPYLNPPPVVSGPYWGDAPYRGVSGAEVRVISGSDTTWLIEGSDRPCTGTGGESEGQGAGCYRASLPAPVLSGATYALDIRLADGTRITGETVPPEAIAISAPAPNLHVTVSCRDGEFCYGEDTTEPPFTLPVGTVPLGWDLPPSVVGTHLALQPLAAYLEGAVYPRDACTLGYYGGFASQQYRYRPGDDGWAIPSIGCGLEHPELRPARFDSIRAQLVVMGLNQTYVDYLTSGAGQGIRSEAASYGIEGAYGVFGAMSRATREIVLVRDPPPLPTPESTP